MIEASDYNFGIQPDKKDSVVWSLRISGILQLQSLYMIYQVLLLPFPSTTDVFFTILTDRKSFENVQRWVDDVHAQRGNDVLIVIVGNKSDMEEERFFITFWYLLQLEIFIRVVRKEDGEEKAKSFDANFVEVSAKSGDNIISLFKVIASTLPGTETSQMVSMSARLSTTQGQNAGPTSNPTPQSSTYDPPHFSLKSFVDIQLNPATVNEADQKKTQKSNSQGCC